MSRQRFLNLQTLYNWCTFHFPFSSFTYLTTLVQSLFLHSNSKSFKSFDPCSITWIIGVLISMGLFDFLGWVRKNPDGTITRLVNVPDSPPTGIDASVPVQSIDVPLNTTNNTWVRIFRPTNVPPNSKLPLVIYYHGGGFVLLSAATFLWHDFCVLMANELNVVIVSLEYRLTPENRLPAAYEDAMDSILWAKEQASGHENLFIKDIVDFSKCFVMGTSAGGNMAYHVGLRALSLDLGPLKIIGLILDHVFFGGVERSGSEIRLIDDEILPLPATDLMWELSLPIGADRDHEFSNPMLKRTDSAEIGLLPWCLVRGYEGDPLVDRMKEAVKMLEGEGVKVVGKFYDGGYHAMEVFDPKTSQSLLNDFKEFIFSTVCN